MFLTLRTSLFLLLTIILAKSSIPRKTSIKGDISTALKTLQIHQKGQGIIFILSDFSSIDKQKFEQIAALSKQNLIYFLNIFDVLEEVAPPSDEYSAEYGKQKLTFDSSSEAFRLAYRKYFADKRNILKQNCRKFSVQYAEIRTDIPLFKQLRIM